MEGVIKFQQDFRKTRPVDSYLVKDLNLCRQILFENDLVGCDPERYGGKGFGNLSKRLEGSSFIITGTQTGELKQLTNSHYSVVLRTDLERNLVVSRGPLPASSESMSHGAIYESDPSINYVFHVHSPDIWRNSRELEIPCLSRKFGYGTPEIAQEIKSLIKDKKVRRERVISMDGHEDGIISFGEYAYGTLSVLLNHLYRSFNQTSW